MTTAWTLTAEEICRDALEHLGVVGAMETVNASDQQIALKALDGVLKELPLYGYVWPKLSGEVALTWGGAGAQTMVLPADYYNFPAAWKLLNGQRMPLTPIAHADWVQMTNRAATGPVTHFYISPANVFYMYPTPNEATDPAVTLQYQRIVDDAVASLTADVLQTMKNPLGYGVANELKFKFMLDKVDRDDIERTWGMKRGMAIESALSFTPISVAVQD